MSATELQLLLCGVLIILVVIYGALFWMRRLAFKRSLSMVFMKVLLPRKDSDSDERKDTTHDFKGWIGLMEQLLAGLRSISEKGWREQWFGSESISFELVAEKQEIFFYVAVPKRAQFLVEKQITGFYADAIVEIVPEPNIFSGKKAIAGAEIVLERHPYMPIRTYQKLESDPMNTLLGSLSKLDSDEGALVQILVRSVPDNWQSKARKFATKLAKRKGKSESIMDKIVSMLSMLWEKPSENKEPDKKDNDTEQFIDEKSKKSGFETSIRIVTTATEQMLAESELDNIAASFYQLGGPGYNAFKVSKAAKREKFFTSVIFRSLPMGPWRARPILNSEEIATVFHFPHSKYNTTPEIRWQNFKVVKAPMTVSTEGILLGTNLYRGVRKQIFMKNEDRFRHFYVIGQTGTGKSTMLISMARQDIKNGKGLCVMDPHGDLANDLLPHVPRNRADDVIYFDPSDLSRPMGLNLLEANTPDEKQMVAQDSLNMMIKLYGNEIFGPRIQDYFRNGALTLMDYPGGAALTDMMQLFANDEFQKERRRTLKDPIVKAWWEGTYSKQWDREKAEIIPYFQAKFGAFITNTMMRNIIGQVKSSFNVYDAMQDGKILFVNLSKGILGDFNSKLLGMIMVSKIQMAAMRRQLIDKSERKDYFLYIDEFQNYVTDSIESILSEARKYRLGLVVAHQYLGQLHKSDALTKSDVNLKDAIFGNVGSIMSYRVGPEDAEFLEKQFAPQFGNRDLINMDKFKGVTKLHVDGQTTTPFSLIPENPYLDEGDKKLAKAFKELSRLKYGREREFVEKEIIFRIGSAI